MSVTGSTLALRGECHQHRILEYKYNVWLTEPSRYEY
jgi:hypothetical protein